VFPTLLMPLIQSISWVALPVIRSEFQIPADVTAWVATVFTLPYIILSPVYGRLSDGMGKRRLILAGCLIFSLGTAITVFGPGLPWLMVGRAIQGTGTAGMMPLAMAYILDIFDVRSRGRALGLWSSVGPTTTIFGPLLAGFLVEGWGWRVAIAPPLLVGLLAFVVVRRWIPAGLSSIQPGFLRSFDWAGVGLLAGCLTGLLFYLSSRPITGVSPLKDLRLLSITLVLSGLFVWWERRRQDPFVNLRIFINRNFNTATFSAAMRLFCLAGTNFLIPLYLADARQLSPSLIGILSMVPQVSMAVIVFWGGQVSDRLGSRVPAAVGLGLQTATAVLLYLLPGTASLWLIGVGLVMNGLGGGLSLASLHRAALEGIPGSQMGAAAGLYSMLRFFGGVLGTALAGVILQGYFDQLQPVLQAYQNTFLIFVGAGILGALTSSRLH